MNYKTNFATEFDLFIDRMSYVDTQYTRLMEWKKPDIGIWKTMWQYFFTFMQSYLEECKANGIDYNDRTQVYNYFDKFTREPHIKAVWYNTDYRSQKMNDDWEIILNDEDKRKCNFD